MLSSRVASEMQRFGSHQHLGRGQSGTAGPRGWCGAPWPGGWQRAVAPGLSAVGCEERGSGWGGGCGAKRTSLDESSRNPQPPLCELRTVLPGTFLYLKLPEGCVFEDLEGMASGAGQRLPWRPFSREPGEGLSSECLCQQA